MGCKPHKAYATSLLDKAHAALAPPAACPTHALHALADLVGGRSH
jgi:hypothetical protein